MYDNLWQATSNGENYFMTINNDGTYQNQYCKDGTNYISHDNVASEITTAQFSYKTMIDNAYEEISVFTDLATVITKLPFVSASLTVNLDEYIFNIAFDASSIETVNADTLYLQLEFDIKGNFQGYTQTYILENQIVGHVTFNNYTEQMLVPHWFDINDFTDLINAR